jgi:transcriptional regulator with XRE-family HTH domain
MTGEELKTWRKASGLTQKEAADALGIHYQTLSTYERNFYPIPRTVQLATIGLTALAVAA